MMSRHPYRDEAPSVIVEHGLISSRFTTCASVEATFASPGIAWIGSVDPTPEELERIARAFGLSDRALAQRRRSRRTPRSRVTLLEHAAHLILLGVRPDADPGSPSARKGGRAGPPPRPPEPGLRSRSSGPPSSSPTDS
jgi:hypothetical protein